MTLHLMIIQIMAGSKKKLIKMEIRENLQERVLSYYKNHGLISQFKFLIIMKQIKLSVLSGKTKELKMP